MSNKVPDGWSEGAFGTFITLQRGFDLPVQDRLPGNVPVYASNGVIGSHCEARIPGPSVVTGRSGTLGKVFYYPEGCWPLNTTLYVKNFHGNDPSFVYRFLAYFDLERFGTGTGVPTLNRNIVHEETVVFPPLPEQRRIAEILSSVDDTIQATEAANNQVSIIRAKALKSLFPTDLKVGMSLSDAFSGWKVLPAHEATTGIVDCKNRTPPRTQGGYAVVRTPNVRNGRFIDKGLHFTDAASFAEWTRKGKPQSGDILFTREAPFGEVCAAPESLEFCLGQRMMFFRPNPDILSSTYLLFTLQSAGVQKDLLLKAGGSTVGHLRVNDVRNIPIPVAPKERQEEIASFLTSLDEMVDNGMRNLEQLLKMKTALVSDLLTGRKRVFSNLAMAAE